VKAAGIEPRSTLMKSIYTGHGLFALVMTICFAYRLPRTWWGMVAAAILGLWYLPIGTAVDVLVLVLLLFFRSSV
jgi:hypothetical protein